VLQKLGVPNRRSAIELLEREERPERGSDQALTGGGAVDESRPGRG
jgi:hypothetical protein